MWFVLLVGCTGGKPSDAWTIPDDPPPPDVDSDGVPDAEDNCPELANTDQIDVDIDLVGDACDDLIDADVDGIGDDVDICQGLANPDQLDRDVDGVGDECDNCPDLANLDQLDDNADGVGNACPCDICLPGQWCTLHPDPELWPTACSDECNPQRQGDDGKCCPLGSKWYPEDGDCLFGDIYADSERLLDSIEFEIKRFDEDSCEVYEGCVNGTGFRRLLRFDTTTPNIGKGDLFLGRPEDVQDIFTYSECHEHYHMDTYADYQLLDLSGNVVAPGHKQAFCLMDFEPWAEGVSFWDAEYHCGNQGISKGFADTYDSYLDCQFVDITDVPAGDYLLRVTLNYEHLLAESDYTNDVTEVQVTIPEE
jgi:hypothetical protein